MADINIQRKKNAPSPWILVLLAAFAVAVAAYFFLRLDPASEPVPTGLEATPTNVLPPDTAALPPIASEEEETENLTAAALAAQAETDPAAPNYAVNGLQKLTGILVAITDRTDLRDPAIREQRDNLTSATSRLDEPNSSVRPGFVAAANLIRGIQQQAYPELEGAAAELVSLAGQLSGRSATTEDQLQTKQFLTQAAAVVRVISEPAQ
ncbi:hypothetical protein [Hymenobacter sp. IS2118]|uniref:hypothetical protein n=1 Tax=Hymenobacter sp. IS2118 TaxID=1505605 RepID=UPI00054E62FF|nr:hypothetical protein [Hymenobacter sp. IS2118]